MATLVTVSAVQPVSGSRTGRTSSTRDFVVVCPDHPHVTLMKRKPGLFSRTKVIHSHCPLCQRQQHHHWSDNEASSHQNNYDQFGGLAPPSHHHSDAFDNHYSSTSWEPSAPFDDATVATSEQRHYATPTIEEGDEDGSVSASMIDMIESLERTSIHPHSQHRHAGASQSSPLASAVNSSHNDIADNITALVHSLLEGHRKGPDFILNQLEMLAAWSTADDLEIKQAITDAGGIYIVINVLQRCLERLNETGAGTLNNRAVGTSHQFDATSPHRVQQSYQNDFGGDTTIATHTLDDGTIATHVEEIDDFDSLPTAFATAVSSSDGAEEPSWTPTATTSSSASHVFTSGHHTTTSTRYTISSNHSTTGGSTVTGSSSVNASSFVASRPPTWNAIHQAFSQTQPMQQQQQCSSNSSMTFGSFTASQPPTLNALGQTTFATASVSGASIPESTTSTGPNNGGHISNSNRQPEHGMKGSVNGVKSHAQNQFISSAPAPTMDDIERAFGRFLQNPSSDDSTVGGDSTTLATPQTHHHTVLSPAFPPSGGGESWISGYSMPSSYRLPPQEHPQETQSSVSDVGPSSTASSSFAPQYVPPEALDGVMSMATMKTIDSETIRREVRLAVATLDNLIQVESNVDIFRTAGGIEAVLSTMWRFEQDEMTQEHGCECLYSLVSVKKGSHHIKSMIVSFGGISTMMRSMTLFPASPRILETCCLFLGIMALHDPVSLQSIITLKGAQAILGSMRLHRVDEKLQEAACETLESMMRHDDQVYMDIVFNRGVEAFLTAMWQFEQSGIIQRAGCACLGLVCRNDDGNKRIVLEYGAIESILRAMKVHNQNVYVQRAGILALAEISYNHNEALARCLAEENAMETLRQAAGEADSENEACKKFLRSLRLYKYRSRVF